MQKETSEMTKINRFTVTEVAQRIVADELEPMLQNASEPSEWLAELERYVEAGTVPEWFELHLCEGLEFEDGYTPADLFRSCFEQLLDRQWDKTMLWVFPNADAANRYADQTQYWVWDDNGQRAPHGLYALSDTAEGDDAEGTVARACGATRQSGKTLRDHRLFRYFVERLERTNTPWCGWFVTGELLTQ